MAEPTDVERDLQRLETELRRLEAEYNMFFAGRLPKPPWETRTRVDLLVKKFDRGYIQNYGDRFRCDAAVALRHVHRSLGPRSAREGRGPR